MKPIKMFMSVFVVTYLLGNTAAAMSCFDLLESCKAAIKDRTASYQAGQCGGQLDAALFFVNWMKLACLPVEPGKEKAIVTNGQLIELYVDWAKNHLKELEKNGTACLVTALSTAFPCPTK